MARKRTLNKIFQIKSFRNPKECEKIGIKIGKKYTPINKMFGLFEMNLANLNKYQAAETTYGNAIRNKRGFSTGSSFDVVVSVNNKSEFKKIMILSKFCEDNKYEFLINQSDKIQLLGLRHEDNSKHFTLQDISINKLEEELFDFQQDILDKEQSSNFRMMNHINMQRAL